MDLFNEIIKDVNLNIGVSSNELVTYFKSHNVNIIDDDLNKKRFYHYIVLDKELNLKKVFRALRNGGYLITKIKYDDDLLYDLGFSAISRIDEFFIIKKVHSWNDI